jgi:hypothetical protein
MCFWGFTSLELEKVISTDVTVLTNSYAHKKYKAKCREKKYLLKPYYTTCQKCYFLFNMKIFLNLFLLQKVMQLRHFKKITIPIFALTVCSKICKDFCTFYVFV